MPISSPNAGTVAPAPLPGTRRLARTLLLTGAALAGLALSGCVRLSSKPPAHLLTIGIDRPLASGKDMSSQGLPSLAVAAPEIPRKLATTRIPVQVNPTSVAYVKNAQWTEAPRDLFRRLLTDTITAGGKNFVIDDALYGLHPERQLSGELVDFGLDAQRHEAIVTFDAVLIRIDDHQAIRRRFSAHVPVADISAGKVAAPLSRAANQVAQEIAAWVAGS